MADLDTRNKRGSNIGFDFVWGHIYPNPDGTISQADRQQIAVKYPGISSSAAATFTPRLPLLGVG